MGSSIQSLKHTARGMTFIEVLLSAGLISLFFFGVIGGVQLALKTIGYARAEAGALALANERIEHLRSLGYDAVGTVGGIPAGSVPQSETLTLNNITYSRRTLIQYVDAPQDGLDGEDENGITADYKRAKVEIGWVARGEEKTLSLVTNLVPRSIETLAGGGTLRINVFDAVAAPVADALVRVQNASTTPPIDVTVYTNASGTVLFPGAPASGGYMVSATKEGYSTDQTYAASGGNPNPNPPAASVLAGEVSTLNFSIDRLSALTINAVLPPVLTHSDDAFTDGGGLSGATSSVITAGTLTLATSSSLYVPAGSARTVGVAPASLYAWEEASWVASVPVSAALRVRVYARTAAGEVVLIPDTVLPGNALGFTASPIDIRALSVDAYPELALDFELESTDGVDAPMIESRRLSYYVADVPVSGVDFSVSGTKNIGSDSLGVPIKKYAAVHTTSASGQVALPSMEWDVYTVSIGASEGYDISDACPQVPMVLAPNSAETLRLVLGDHTARSLLVRAQSGAGVGISSASIRVSGGSFDETVAASACGYAHFSALPSGGDYTITVEAVGYGSETMTAAVSGTETLTVVLQEN